MRDPIQSKRITSWLSVVIGLVFVIFALIHGYSQRLVAFPQETDMPTLILLGIGSLGLSIELIVSSEDCGSFDD